MDGTLVMMLRAAVDKLKADPSLIHNAELDFFRDYVTSLGATLPPQASKPAPQPEPVKEEAPPATDPPAAKTPTAPVEDDQAEALPPPELDTSPALATVDDDSNPLPQGAGTDATVSEEDEQKAQESRAAGQMAQADRKFEEAVKCYTDSIVADPRGSRTFILRAKALLKQKRPNAALRDASAALQRNPDSAGAFKCRGQAYAMLGKWIEANKDLSQAMSIDYDDSIAEVAAICKANSKAILSHERKVKAFEEENKAKAAAKAKAEAEAAKKAASASAGSSSAGAGASAGGMPGMGGAGGMPGMGGAGGMPGMGNIMSDPELMAMMSDPEVMTALQEVMGNPAAMAKHQSNPKIARVISKLTAAMGSGGAGGAAPGGAPMGAAGGMGGMGAPPRGGGGAPPMGGMGGMGAPPMGGMGMGGMGAPPMGGMGMGGMGMGGMGMGGMGMGGMPPQQATNFDVEEVPIVHAGDTDDEMPDLD